MPGFIDRKGQRYGRLTVLCETTRTSPGRVRWLCRCDCGNVVAVNSSDLCGRSQSCGCYRTERIVASGASRAKHGHARSGGGNRRITSPEYKSWKAMKERCKNKNAPNYHLYGGRGISVCDRWLGEDGFTNFLSDMGERPDGHTLDRIDTDGNYEPGNCRWASAKAQARNRRQTPEYKATQKASLDRGREKMWSDPEIRARLLEARRKKHPV